MIIRNEDLPLIQRENAKGGVGVFINKMILQEDQFHNKGRLFARCKLAPGHSVGSHTHVGEMEICYFLNGVGTVESDGIRTQVYPGDVNIVNAGENHSVINTGKTDLEYIALILYTE